MFVTINFNSVPPFFTPTLLVYYNKSYFFPLTCSPLVIYNYDVYVVKKEGRFSSDLSPEFVVQIFIALKYDSVIWCLPHLGRIAKSIESEKPNAKFADTITVYYYKKKNSVPSSHYKIAYFGTFGSPE